MTTETKTTENATPVPTPPQSKTVQTDHTVTIQGKPIAYTATAGTYILNEEKFGEGDKKDVYEGEKPRVEIFYTAYTKKDVKDIGERPITFAFNGGPGAPSLWVHLGVLGPRRVALNEDGSPLPPPSKLVDNEFSLLDRTDLVMIDPVGTGFSRAVSGDKPKDFWGWKKDIESVGEFIRSFIAENGRWGSPKYIAGESYGTTRATGLADYLSDKHGLYLNGIILISTALDFMTLDFYDGNDLPYVTFLPTYATAAWKHGKIAEKYRSLTLKEVAARSSEFASSEYMSALFAGDRLSVEQKRAVAEKTAEWIGLSADYILKSNLRVSMDHFGKELLRGEGKVIGRFDARFTGPDKNGAGESPSYDPSDSEISGIFAGALNDYLNRELNFKTDREYNISNALWRIWDYKEFQNRYVQLEEMLHDTMVRNKFMRVWVLNGYYDLATPFFAAEFVFNHLNLTPELRKNLTMTYYEAGHMLYIHRPSLVKFRRDAEEFFDGKSA